MRQEKNQMTIQLIGDILKDKGERVQQIRYKDFQNS